MRRFVENQSEGNLSDGSEQFFSARACAREETDEDELRRGKTRGDERRQRRIRTRERDDGDIVRQRQAHQIGAGIGDDGHTGIRDLRDGGAFQKRFDELRPRRFLIVLVIGDDFFGKAQMVQQDARVARVFAGDDVRVRQNLCGAARHVRQISNRCRHEIQRAGRDFAHVGSFP